MRITIKFYLLGFFFLFSSSDALSQKVEWIAEMEKSIRQSSAFNFRSFSYKIPDGPNYVRGYTCTPKE